jgi:aminomethyltransferase
MNDIGRIAFSAAPGHWEVPLRPTPFHPRLEAANRRRAWAGWSGWASVPVFDDLDMEYSAIRNTATLYDLTPMVKYSIEGAGAAAFLNRLTLRDAGRLAVGAVHYTAWCDDAGHLLDDGTLFRLSPSRFRLCCQERHLPWLRDTAAGFDVEVEEETGRVAALSLQGPTAAAVLAAAGLDVAALRPFRCATHPLGAGMVMVSRTGFTGDLGYELWTDAGLALALWDALMAAGTLWGLRPIGSQALNIARLEAGFIVTGQDFTPADQCLREDRLRSPLEMGLGWMIDWDKGHFTGRRALIAQRAAGPVWAFAGLETEGNIPAEGAILYRARRHEAGVVTGACWSPILKRSIALAQVRRRDLDRADLWAEIYALRELHYSKLMVRARQVDRPFLSLDRRRATPPGST